MRNRVVEMSELRISLWWSVGEWMDDTCVDGGERACVNDGVNKCLHGEWSNEYACGW